MDGRKTHNVAFTQTAFSYEINPAQVARRRCHCTNLTEQAEGPVKPSQKLAGQWAVRIYLAFQRFLS